MEKVNVSCDENDVMTDLRAAYSGLVMGKFKDVARQNGIFYNMVDNICECAAPQERMQIFIDKLDCCGIEYEVL